MVAMVAAKVGVEARRERDRQRIIEELARREFGAGWRGIGTGTGKTDALGEGVARNYGPPRKLCAIFGIIAARMISLLAPGTTVTR